MNSHNGDASTAWNLIKACAALGRMIAIGTFNRKLNPLHFVSPVISWACFEDDINVSEVICHCMTRVGVAGKTNVDLDQPTNIIASAGSPPVSSSNKSLKVTPSLPLIPP